MTDRPGPVAAIVLAAGKSRRMGCTNKMLAEVDGRAMVLHAVDAALASRAAPVIVVSGHEADALHRTLAGRPVTLVHNPAYADGMSTSLRAGLAAVPRDATGVVVLLGDMPRITAGHLDHLIAAFDAAAGPRICLPMVGGRRGNPVLLSRDFFDEMMDLAGDVGARGLIERHADVVITVPMDDEAALIDVDTREALKRLNP